MQVEQRKINELIETGLNIQQHTRAFWTFRICYHFKDFVKVNSYIYKICDFYVINLIFPKF